MSKSEVQENSQGEGEAFAVGLITGISIVMIGGWLLMFSSNGYDEKQNLRCQVMYGSDAVMVRPYDKPMSCSEDIKRLPEDYRP